MDLEESNATRVTRRRVVGAGAKLAYAAPLVAASFRLGTLDARAACGCPPGTVPVPEVLVAGLRKKKKSALATKLSGKCVGCASGPIKAPATQSAWSTLVNSIGKACKSCPGKGNKSVLKDQVCDPDPISR